MKWDFVKSYRGLRFDSEVARFHFLAGECRKVLHLDDRLQSDSSTIDDACETDIQTYKDKVLHIFQQAMTPTHYLANILQHPQYRGKNLLPDQVSSAQDLLLQTSPDILQA
ncbi:hypothetical protein ScPMuIL_000882 [Solemya velum]